MEGLRINGREKGEREVGGGGQVRPIRHTKKQDLLMALFSEELYFELEF